MRKPTESAEISFSHAGDLFMQAGGPLALDDKIRDLYIGLANVTLGLESLATGLRATYMKLDEIERRLMRPAGR